MGEGIKKLINNKESLEDLDERAARMKSKHIVMQVMLANSKKGRQTSRGCSTGGI